LYNVTSQVNALQNVVPNLGRLSHCTRHVRIRQRLAELIEVKKLDDAGLQQLTALIRRFVENSRQRQAKIDYHLERAAECLGRQAVAC